MASTRLRIKGNSVVVAGIHAGMGRWKETVHDPASLGVEGYSVVEGFGFWFIGGTYAPRVRPAINSCLSSVSF